MSHAFQSFQTLENLQKVLMRYIIEVRDCIKAQVVNFQNICLQEFLLKVTIKKVLTKKSKLD